jgi:hypothetical protein
MLLLVEQETGKESPKFRSRVRGLLIANIREEITAAGSGTRIPEFRGIAKRR